MSLVVEVFSEFQGPKAQPHAEALLAELVKLPLVDSIYIDPFRHTKLEFEFSHYGSDDYAGIRGIKV